MKTKKNSFSIKYNNASIVVLIYSRQLKLFEIVLMFSFRNASLTEISYDFFLLYCSTTINVGIFKAATTYATKLGRISCLSAVGSSTTVLLRGGLHRLKIIIFIFISIFRV
jgi:hypothetical protein